MHKLLGQYKYEAQAKAIVFTAMLLQSRPLYVAKSQKNMMPSKRDNFSVM